MNALEYGKSPWDKSYTKIIGTLTPSNSYISREGEQCAPPHALVHGYAGRLGQIGLNCNDISMNKLVWLALLVQFQLNKNDPELIQLQMMLGACAGCIANPQRNSCQILCQLFVSFHLQTKKKDKMPGILQMLKVCRHAAEYGGIVAHLKIRNWKTLPRSWVLLPRKPPKQQQHAANKPTSRYDTNFNLSSNTNDIISTSHINEDSKAWMTEEGAESQAIWLDNENWG